MNRSRISYAHFFNSIVHAVRTNALYVYALPDVRFVHFVKTRRKIVQAWSPTVCCRTWILRTSRAAGTTGWPSARSCTVSIRKPSTSTDSTRNDAKPTSRSPSTLPSSCARTCHAHVLRDVTVFVYVLQEVRGHRAASRGGRYGADEEPRLEVRLHVRPEFLQTLQQSSVQTKAGGEGSCERRVKRLDCGWLSRILMNFKLSQGCVVLLVHYNLSICKSVSLWFVAGYR